MRNPSRWAAGTKVVSAVFALMAIGVASVAIYAQTGGDTQQIRGETYTAEQLGPWSRHRFGDKPRRGDSLDSPLGDATPGACDAPSSGGHEDELGLLEDVTGATAPSLRASFDGVRWRQCEYTTDEGVIRRYPDRIPPTSTGAVGLEHYVEVVEDGIFIFEKSALLGTGPPVMQSSEYLTQFFADHYGGAKYDGGLYDLGVLYNPRILFDQHSERWIIVVTNGPGGRLGLGVSEGPDPTGVWYTTSFAASATGCWADYPTLGVDARGIYVGAEMFGCTPITMTLWAIDKTPLVPSGSSEPKWGTLTAWRGLERSRGNQPAHTYGDPGCEYIIGKALQSSFDQSWLRIYRITPPLTDPRLDDQDDWLVPVNKFAPPADAPALDSPTPIHTMDDRLTMAVYRDGSLWTTHCIAANVDGTGPSVIRWYEIDPGDDGIEPEAPPSPSVIQLGTVTHQDLWYYMPSLMVNSARNVVMGFSGSSAGEYVGAYYTGRQKTDPPGQMASPQLLKDGDTAYQRLDNYQRNRWTDYSATSLDPSDETTFWTIQEYAASPADTWGTWIGVLDWCAPDPHCDDGDACTSDACEGGTCTHLDVSCNDADACTTDGCDWLSGCTNTPVDCDDADACTTDGCDPTSGCTHTPLDCDDGNVCTTDSCVGGACQHVDTVGACPDDGNSCTDDVCSGGACTHPPKAAGTACGSFSVTVCDNRDTCNGSGKCRPNFKPSTTPCRAAAGSCDAAEYCTGTSATCPDDLSKPDGTACDDDDPGTIADACIGGVCTGVPVECTTDGDCVDDGNPCTNDVCSGGTCTHPPKAARTACGSSSDTVCDGPDTCDESGTCLPNYKPSDTVCRAAVGPCDEVEKCTGTSATCPADAWKLSDSECRPASGECDLAEHCTGASVACPTDALKLSGTICRAAEDPCDAVEVCTGVSVTCPADVCEPDGTACEDGNALTLGDVCWGCVCTAGCLDADCDDGNPCTTDSCVDGVCQNVNHTSTCDDGDACTDFDTCSNGICAGTPLDCSDGLYCNGVETCDPAIGCKPGVWHNCADAVVCTVDSCDEATDSCKHTPDDGLCDDGNASTFDGCDATSGCFHTEDTTCLPRGAACVLNADCCSNSCRGRTGRKTCY